MHSEAAVMVRYKQFADSEPSKADKTNNLLYIKAVRLIGPFYEAGKWNREKNGGNDRELPTS